MRREIAEFLALHTLRHERWLYAPVASGDAAALPKQTGLPVKEAMNVSATPTQAAGKADAPTGGETLEDIRRDLGDCQRCGLHTTRTNIVFGEGDPHAELMFVGEGPGADEDESGRPFVGRAGQLLTKMIEAMGYARQDVYIANIVKSRPPNNRDPKPEEIAACIPFLLRQIKAIRPKVIVTLGRPAAVTLLGIDQPISAFRGTWQRLGDADAMPTYHPAYLLRSPSQKKVVWEDLKLVMNRLGKPIPAKGGQE